MNRRQLTLGGALATTLVATAWVATRQGAATAPVVAAASSPRPAVSAASASHAKSPQRQPWAEASPEQLVAWQPPPPPPPPTAPAPTAAPPPPPPPPIAPPLPYQMIGRVVEGSAEVALLSGPSNVLSVKPGDVIDGQWRVEQVTTSGVGLTWLPSNLSQNLVFKAVP